MKIYKKQARTEKLSIIIPLLIFTLFFVLAIPLVEYVENTPSNNAITSNRSIEIWTNITESSLANITFNWNGTNFTIFDENLVLAYNFNNLSSLGENDTHVFDISGNGNNGTVVGAIFNASARTNGNYDGAYKFDGNDYIIINGSAINISNANPITFSLWFYPTPRVNFKNILVIGTADNRNGYYIKMDYVSNQTLFSRTNDTSSGFEGGTGLNSIKLNTWNNVFLTFDGTTRSFYLNNVLKGTRIETTGSNVIQNSTTKFRLGNALVGFTNGLNGSIDEFRVWNKSLTSSEVQQLYYSNLKKFDSDSWQLYVNQSNLTTGTKGSLNYTYFSCATNSSGSENCTGTRVITIIPFNNNITSNFSLSIGNIRNDFYGINTRLQPSSKAFVDANGIDSLDTEANQTFYQNEILNLNIRILRTSMFLFDTTNTDNTFKNTAGLHSNIDGKREIVEFANDNNLIVLLIADDTPNHMANKTLGYCNSTAWQSCPPINHTEYANLIVSYIDNVTNNGEWNNSVMIEIKNEIDGVSWLNNLSVTNVIKSIEYNKVYNATYDAIKDKYPNMAVGGFGGGSLTLTTGSLFLMQNFMGNFSNKMDFFSYHESLDYPTELNFDITLENAYSSIFGNMTLFGVSNRTIYISETNIFNSTVQNDTSFNNLHGMQIGLSLLGSLINYPENVSVHYFNLYSRYKYETGFGRSFPFKFQMLSEPQLDNAYYPPYNVTRNFATYCPTGATVYNSTSTTGDLVSVSCNKGGTYSTIIINKGSEAINVSSTFPSDLLNIRDLKTRISYTIINEQINPGILAQYGIFYLANGIYGSNENIFWNRELEDITEDKSTDRVLFNNTHSSNLDLEIYNLTNALIYNPNGTVYGNSNVNSNDGNVNITLQAGNSSFVLDNYNITKSVDRDNDPLWNSTLNLINNTLDSDITVTTYGWTNAFMYFSNGSVKQGGDQTITISSGGLVFITNQWNGTLNSTLNRIYKDSITLNGNRNLTIIGSGTVTFTSEIIFTGSNQHIIQNSGTTFVLESGAQIR